MCVDTQMVNVCMLMYRQMVNEAIRTGELEMLFYRDYAEINSDQINRSPSNTQRNM